MTVQPLFSFNSRSWNLAQVLMVLNFYWIRFEYVTTKSMLVLTWECEKGIIFYNVKDLSRMNLFHNNYLRILLFLKALSNSFRLRVSFFFASNTTLVFHFFLTAFTSSIIKIREPTFSKVLLLALYRQARTRIQYE